jgi:hypothetical protein
VRCDRRAEPVGAGQAITPPDSPALDRRTCLANGNWYGFYRNNHGLIPICLKLPEAISAKMLDSNDDGVVDSNDMLSNGVTFTGDNSENAMSMARARTNPVAP